MQAAKSAARSPSVDLDKPWMTTGPNPDDPDQDIIYLSYTEFERPSSVLYADELAFLSNSFLAHNDQGGRLEGRRRDLERAGRR